MNQRSQVARLAVVHNDYFAHIFGHIRPITLSGLISHVIIATLNIHSASQAQLVVVNTRCRLVDRSTHRHILESGIHMTTGLRKEYAIHRHSCCIAVVGVVESEASAYSHCASKYDGSHPEVVHRYSKLVETEVLSEQSPLLTYFVLLFQSK
jgi:hypothetical protein